ncbi:MAG TPA: DEAD/DEAH box helicase [Actinomycetota bacterium]|nr:DEAD/DEAH box helicase [Actinomycetota bacterium]
MSTFTELGVSAPVVQALARRGIEAPFKIQNLVLGDGLAGRDILAKSRTGSGKTLGFGIPIVERLDASMKRPAALVMVPTRELAVQVAVELSDIALVRNLKVATVYGGVGLDAQAKRAARAHVIVATPGRLQDLLERRMISLDHISILVLDEADRMLDMGFQPQVDKIVARLKGRRQTMFFSATLDGRVGQLARNYTHDPVRHEVVEDKPAIAAASHRFLPVSDEGKIDALVRVLGEERDLALVFVRTKHGADRLCKKLRARGIDSLAIHGNKSQNQRQRALDRFTDGHVDVLVATDVAARGLDVDDISHVINFDPPHDHTDYVHRVGRTARAGRLGAGVTFVAPANRKDVGAIARALKLTSEFESDGLVMAAAHAPAAGRARQAGNRSGNGDRSRSRTSTGNGVATRDGARRSGRRPRRRA